MNLFKRTKYIQIYPKNSIVTRHGVATPFLMKEKGTEVDLIVLIEG